MESKQLSDAALLDTLLEPPHDEQLTDEQREAFQSMRDRDRFPLSEKQAKWVRGVAERLGIQTAPSENLFSSMSPEKQAEQRKRAARIKLPWE